MKFKHSWEMELKIREQANRFRKKPTPQERRLWQSLRGKKLDGHYFRRQHVIGPFITDFCCVKARVIVEVDGGVHHKQREYDKHREEWLSQQGYKVLRFSNEQIVRELQVVLSEVLDACTG